MDLAVFYIPANTVGYIGDGFYRSKDPTNSIKVLRGGNENVREGLRRYRRSATSHFTI